MGTISENFSYREFEVTDIPNLMFENVIRDAYVRDSVKALVLNVLQPLRDAWGSPLAINSGYRCPTVNKAVGGVPTSQHTKGEAADMCPFGRNGHGSASEIKRLAKMVIDLGLPFDQVILYPSFVHISHKLDGQQRGRVLYSKTWRGGDI